MSWIKEGVKVFLITISLYLVVDFATTWLYGARAFSIFFVSNNIEGRHNRPEFTGYFGGIFYEFNGQVNIGRSGERLSDPSSCENVLSKVLFIGDSTTAGFEVDDKETFISHLNSQCSIAKISGTNFGVRAHDTHAVIGSYERVSSHFPHDYVVYLMTENDFEENVQPDVYVNMTKRFGRRFEGEIIKPVDDLMWTAYASLRVFVADRLAFTTAIIRLLERQMRDAPIAVLDDTTEFERQAQKTFELIQQLSYIVSANGAELIIIPYPRVSSDIDYKRSKKIKLLSELIGNNLGGVFYIHKIDALVGEKVKLDGKALFDMRFNNDGHLSKYGHQIISKVLLDVFQDLKRSAN